MTLHEKILAYIQETKVPVQALNLKRALPEEENPAQSYEILPLQVTPNLP